MYLDSCDLKNAFLSDAYIQGWGGTYSVRELHNYKLSRLLRLGASACKLKSQKIEELIEELIFIAHAIYTNIWSW